MRIVGLVLLAALVATLGLLACVAPAAAPATTATPAPTIAPYVPPPTPPMPTPRPGATPLSSVTKTYIMTGNKSETLALKTGDLVVLTVAFEGGTNVGVDVDAPPLGVNAAPADRVALMGQGVPDGETRKLSFVAKFDGNYTLNVWQRNVAVTGGTATVKIDIYR
ncbi:MAG: hypothetical protein KJ624_02585 [Chloroflexi bacterium]|nr:hypothetical protein [Chloroflexota bacterium]